MPHQQTHVDVLYSRIASQGSKPFFKAVRKETSGQLTWDIKTYAQLGRDIDALAAHLKNLLNRDGVPDGAVVGVCLNGLSYPDIVHIYALAKARYVPNFISTYLTNSAAVLELLSQTKTTALLHEPGLNLGTNHTIHTYYPVDLSTLESDSAGVLANTHGDDPEGVAFIQYTSGSTGDLPKVIPCTHKWLESVYSSWGSVWNRAGEDEAQDVFNIPGPVSHATGLHVLLMGIYFGASFAQSTIPFFSSDELLLLVSQCGLNRLNLFAPMLSMHIQTVQKQLKFNDDTIYKALLNMRSIVYGGMAMMSTLEDWAFETKFPIMNALGAAETGPLLCCGLGEHPQCMRPFAGLDLEFVPHFTDLAHKEPLFRLAILPTSSNFPHILLRESDGKFYTGDLFAKNENGSWSHKGRDDDWIKVDAAKLVDTRATEDSIRLYCSHIVAEVVIVGNGRPSLALLAEPVQPASGQAEKYMIVDRMAAFNERRYPWERISVDKIVFVEKGTLPKTATKGNVRRKAAEAKFSKEMDALYA